MLCNSLHIRMLLYSVKKNYSSTRQNKGQPHIWIPIKTCHTLTHYESVYMV